MSEFKYRGTIHGTKVTINADNWLLITLVPKNSGVSSQTFVAHTDGSREAKQAITSYFKLNMKNFKIDSMQKIEDLSELADHVDVDDPLKPCAQFIAARKEFETAIRGPMQPEMAQYIKQKALELQPQS